MIECEICNEWYHFGCLGFIGQEADAQGIQFKCMKCMKYEDEAQKMERLDMYRHLFSSDSIMYTYRPPTPELMSEEEVDNKNYNEIMEEVKRSKDKFIGGKKSTSKEEAKKKSAEKRTDDKKKQETEKSNENPEHHEAEQNQGSAAVEDDDDIENIEEEIWSLR